MPGYSYWVIVRDPKSSAMRRFGPYTHKNDALIEARKRRAGDLKVRVAKVFV